MDTLFTRIYLNNIKVLFNGDEVAGNPPRDPSDETQEKFDKDNVVTATLVYPRPGIESLTTIKALDLPSGYLKEFDIDDFWSSGLFKEEIQGEARLALTVIDKDKKDWLAKLFRALISTALGSALGPVVKGIKNLAVATIAGQAQTKLVEAVGSDKDKQQEVARTGTVDLQVADGTLLYRLTEAPTEADREWRPLPVDGKVELPLYAPSPLYPPPPPPQPGSGPRRQQPSRRREAILNKGDANGVVTLLFEV